jgi:hypothetical protein
MNTQPVVKCPNCDYIFFIEAINCAIFRCAVYKETMQQLNPHAPKEICDDLKERDLIYGCGKPFKVVWDSTLDKFHAVHCEYI